MVKVGEKNNSNSCRDARCEKCLKGVSCSMSSNRGHRFKYTAEVDAIILRVVAALKGPCCAVQKEILDFPGCSRKCSGEREFHNRIHGEIVGFKARWSTRAISGCLQNFQGWIDEIRGLFILVGVSGYF